MRHLHYPAALWTTPYGRTFLVKLVLVLGVVALGAWNWRRVRPALGDAAGAARVRRSATAELAAAALVLVTTAILVGMPEVERPGAAQAPPPPPGAGF